VSGLRPGSRTSFAEVLGEQRRAPQPIGWSKLKRAMADGSPILVASVLPASCCCSVVSM
jgi:hypothetical protein